ncbi:MAG: glycoside hydrolase family 2 TIM barrel-domain containing protein [Intestinibacter bartlettii]|uniref:glycoside hydrolase family 2 protein n=1 Tax=Intestinibacter bartlettii TaxID=261299 RepID=UPI0026F23140|nr:glycoside hydrolase family 2 TIM barrel-domain containing protein [Intestinibacter bartlettii]MDO5010030.1 glycoside hydrolase family 2 TIM barrel-domain containing protein [Intestinibacter bartlettii]
MRQIYDFNTKWGFSKEAVEAPTSMPERWNWVNIPHTWNNIDGQDGGNDLYRGTAFYAKELEKIDLPKADRYFLEIQGANSSAIVYVNGKKLANHDGGYSTWRVDITDVLEDRNLFVFEVDNSANDRVYPQNADFTFYGGLYRNVNIIAVSNSHFDLEYYGGPGIKVTPEVVGQNAKVEVEVFVKNAKENQTLLYTLKDAEGNVVAEKETQASETVASFEIENVHLWHGKKDPYLYTAEVCLKEEEVLDNVSTRFGCRTFEIHPENGFILNGEEYPLRGVSRHQDRWGVGNALLPEHHDEDMDLICEVGATTIRLAHYQHDQYFYDLCDERGMVVWAEIPYISSHMPNGRENTISQMKELVVQNYNHPSIVVWGLSNEITMHGDSDEDLRENHVILNDLVHEMDKTRLTTMACVSMCSMDDPYVQIPDTVSYNHYFGWYGGDTSQNGPWFDEFHAKYPNIPIGCSEYGCEALNWHTSDPQQGDYTEEYQAYYHEELIKQFFTRKYMWATHVWNMFDFGADSRNEGGENGQNHKGLITFDRKYKKDSFYAYKAWLSDEPFVHICGKRYVDRVEETTKVTVYSNQPEVELFANGVSLGKQTSPEHFFYFEVPNAGETNLVAVAGDCRDESFIRKVEVFNEEYRLKEKGAILNWFDINEREGYFSLNSKIEDIMKSEEGSKLFMSFMNNLGSGWGNNSKSVSEEDAKKKMKMLGAFKVLRYITLLSATNVKVTKEQLLELNDRLNEIAQ